MPEHDEPDAPTEHTHHDEGERSLLCERCRKDAIEEVLAERKPKRDRWGVEDKVVEAETK